MTVPTRNQKLIGWVDEIQAQCKPIRVEWCDGSRQEYDRLMKLMEEEGLVLRLNENRRLNCFHFRSDPSDVARVEDRTYIASRTRDEAGPTNNWINPAELKKTMSGLYDGCMRGRTMYVIPFSMGPVGSPIATKPWRLSHHVSSTASPSRSVNISSWRVSGSHAPRNSASGPPAPRRTRSR